MNTKNVLMNGYIHQHVCVMRNNQVLLVRKRNELNLEFWVGHILVQWEHGAMNVLVW